MRQIKGLLGFTLIEMIIAMSVVIVLAVLSVGITTKVRNRTILIETSNIFSTIDSALQVYFEAKGKYPEMNNPDNLHQLVKILCDDRIEIRDFKNRIQKKLDPLLDKEALIEQNMIRVINGNFYFVDGWGNKILYFFGNIAGSNYPYLKNAKTDPNDKSILKNSNWPKYDLISKGKDALSNPLILESQKDDLKNF